MISQLYYQRLRKDLFRLSILTLITVVIWIGVATYKAMTRSQVKPDVKKQLLPLTAEIDLDTMKQIKNRQQIQPVNWVQVQPFLPTEIATVSGVVESELPAATGSGQSL